MKARGILNPDRLPEFSQPAVGAVLDPSDPVAVAIADLSNKTALEHERNVLAHALKYILQDDIDAVRDEAMGSDSTQRQYAYELKKFKAWVKQERLSWLPTHECLAHYLFARADEGVSPRTLRHISNGVRWFRRFSDSNSSYDDAIVEASLRYLTRKWKGKKTEDSPPPDPTPDVAIKEKELAHGP